MEIHNVFPDQVITFNLEATPNIIVQCNVFNKSNKSYKN